MISTRERAPMTELRHDLAELRRNWVWFVVLGVALIALGSVALGSVVAASLATAIVFGMLLFAAGLAEVVGAFWARGWSGYFLHLLSGTLSIAVGALFLRAPVDALLVLTLLLAALLLGAGIFKIVAALTYRFAVWGWPVLSGVIDVVLGGLIWLDWPASAFWVLGVFLGVSLVFRGVNWIGLGLTLRTFPRDRGWPNRISRTEEAVGRPR
jgi:uncharacterized membrane protein HdeD (DUF308 family)